MPNSITCEALQLENARLIEALQSSELRFNQITTELARASSLNDGVWDWDLTNNHLYFSPRWKEMLGYEDDELQNAFSTWSNLLHPDDVEMAHNQINIFLESNSLFYENVYRLKHKKEHWVWILDRGIAVRDQNNKPNRLSGSHTDITLLKKVEETVLKHEQELQNIVAICPDGVVTFDSEDVVSSVNPAFLTMTGFTQDDVLMISKAEFHQKMIDLSDASHPYQIEHLENKKSVLIKISHLEKEDLHSKDIDFEVDAKARFQNTTKHHLVRLTPYYLNSVVTPSIMYFRDVTLEMEVDRMKSEFLSVAAHELRLPVSSIYGYSELLLNREFDEATKRDILETIHDQCTGIAEMIEDLLDLARIESGSQQFFNFSVQPLVEIVQETLKNFKMHGGFSKIEVHYFADESLLILADYEQIKRALLNVLSNAFKYSPRNQDVVLEVRERVNQKNVKEIGVIIEDKGIGMTPKQLERIFDRFWRAENVRDIIGTGLGMALVKEIVDFHQGEIDLQSDLGQGTKVSLWFPIMNQSNNNQQ